MNWALSRAKRLQNRQVVNAFGVVLFTERHGNIRKVLHDSYYWSALDNASGERWYIFATMTMPGNWSFPSNEDSGSQPSLKRMSAVWREPKENLDLLNDFELDSTRDLPCLLIFGEATDSQIFRVIMTLDDSSVDSAFKSLRDTIAVATEAIDDIAKENFSNTEGVFAALELSVTSYKQFAFLKKHLSFIFLLKKVLGH